VLVIDALLGVGFQPPMRRGYQSVITRVNASDAAVVAVDIPSGLDPDTGLVGEACMRATLTVTFLVDKLGLHQGAGPKVAGERVLASLGVPDELLTDFSPEAVHVLSAAPLPKRAATVHKGNFGHLLVVAGNLGYGGACVLATEAALKSGVGLLSVVSREEHRTGLMVRCPEAMFVAADDKASIAGLLEKCDAVLIGPGLGQDGWARNVLRQVLASNRPLVVDADALNLVAEGPAPKAKMIMTPHPKEAARLLGQTKVESNRLQVLEALERRYQAVIVLKGAETLVASETDISINVWANPGMATGGMGDVLGGVIGALLAQGLPRYQAACLGVAHHSKAGLLAVERVGEVALLASDVTAEIGVSLAGISHG
jgi:NAD(P)H-hydrate epimerase